MKTVQIVKTAVSAAPYSIDKPYDYLVPESLLESAQPGVRVRIPFGRGNRETEGMILAQSMGEKRPELKFVTDVLDREPVLDTDGIALALWIRQRYFCTLYEAIKAILPAGLWYQLREVWRVTEEDRSLIETMCARIKQAPAILDALFANGGSAREEVLRDICGAEVSSTLRAMRKAGAIVCETDAKRRVGDKTRRMVELAVNAEEALEITEHRRRSAPMAYEVARLLASTGRASMQDIRYFTGASIQTLKAMEKRGLLLFSDLEELRVPQLEDVEPMGPVLLNEEQQSAFEIVRSLSKTGRPEAVLLHGITGSGKTQVYLRLVQDILKRGKSAIVLVPEIILTPQIMRTFSACFGDKVVMLHSSLRMTERYDQWKRIRQGDVRVVLGTRSAIFAPLKNLGLIILDEEQEGSYQSEASPRYHTRDVAKYLCARDRAVLLLGSATPAVETAWAAEQGIYQKAVLRKRYNEQALPKVLIEDLREEVKRGNPSLIGAGLQQALKANLAAGEQSVLFLNRRGNSRYILCGECGYVPECPRCSAALTYHSANGRLMCHHCGHSEQAAEECPKCGGIMKRMGAGTQKVEEELRTLFPEAGILRMDADTTSGGHEKLLSRFERERIPILLGTQMVAKGLDFENVTLVGVLCADLSLYMDHYRAAERTFSLLTQVIGRAGRGGKEGRAIIQTYTPDSDVIQCAAKQDYQGFYDSEIRLRRLRRYPPFADLFTLTVSGMEESSVLRAAAGIRETLRRLCMSPEMAASNPEVLGPAPAPVLKVNNRYRYRCLLVGRNDKTTRECIRWLLKSFANDRTNRGLSIFVDCNAME